MSIIQYKKNSGQLKLTANVVDSDYVFAGFYKRTDSDRILLSNSNTYTFTPTEEINIDCDVRLSPCGEKKHNLINNVNNLNDEIKIRKSIPYTLFYQNFNDNDYFISIDPEYYTSLVDASNGLYGDVVSIKGYNETLWNYNVDSQTISDHRNIERYAWVIYSNVSHDSGAIDSLNFVTKVLRPDTNCFHKHGSVVGLLPWKVDASEENTTLKLYYNEANELIAQIPILSNIIYYHTLWNDMLKNGLPLFKRSQRHGNGSYFETDREKTFNALDRFKTPDYGFYISANYSSNVQSTMMSKKNTSEQDQPILSPELTSSSKLIIEHEYFRHINNGANFEIPFFYSKNITLADGIQPKFGHLYKDSNTNNLIVYIGEEASTGTGQGGDCENKYNELTTHFSSEKFIGYTFEPNVLKLKKSFLLSLYDHFGTDEIVIQVLSGNSIIKLNKGSISSGSTLYLHKDKVRNGNMGPGDVVLDDLSNIELDIDFYEDESVISTIIFAPSGETQVCSKILDMFKLIEVRPKLQDQDQTRVYFKHDTSESKSYIYMDHDKSYNRNVSGPEFHTYIDDNSLRQYIPYLPFANHGYTQDDAGTLNLKLEDVGIHKLTNFFKYISVVGTYIHYDRPYNEYSGPKPTSHLFMSIRYSNVLGQITEMNESLFRPYYSSIPSHKLPTDAIPKSYLNLYELDQDNPNIAITFYHSDQGERVPATDESMRVFVDDQGYSFIAIFRLFTEVGRRYVDYHVRFKMGVIDYPENIGNATTYIIEDVTLLT